MSDTIPAWQQAFFITLTVFNLSSAFIVAVGLVFFRMNSLPNSHKAGLVLVAFGLMWQAWRNMHFLATGVSPADNELPMWALKDIGFWMVCVSAMAAVVGGMRKSKQARRVKVHQPRAARRSGERVVSS